MTRPIIACLCFCAIAAHTQDRLWLDATINGKSARLVLDTGAQEIILFRTGADRLGLKFTSTQTDAASVPIGKTPRLGTTEECRVTLWGVTAKTALPVIEFQKGLGLQENADGVVGWWPVHNDVLKIDALSKTVTPLRRMPKHLGDWTKLQLRTNSSILAIETPDPRQNTGWIGIDTGDPDGVSLSPRLWADWLQNHPREPMTVNSYYHFGTGVVAMPEVWGDKISFGALLLTDVPVEEAPVSDMAAWPDKCEAVLGLAALKRLDFIINGKRGVAYLRPKKTPPTPYEYNRLGAVFLPRNSQSDDLVAHTEKDTPAYDAGIRDGDLLLKIGEVDVTGWRKDPTIYYNGLWSYPAGTRLELTLRRGAQTFQTIVVLRDILGPSDREGHHEGHEE